MAENLQIFREKSPILIATTIYLPLPKYNNLSIIRRRRLSAKPTAYQYVGSFVLFIKEAYSFVVKKTICFSELKKLN